MDMAREEASKEFSMWESFDPEAPLDMFCIADRTKLLDSELDSIIHSLKDAKLEPRITQALRRAPAWQGDGEQSLVRVLAAFRKLQLQFDEKFKKVWA
ncbi:hypothetical protein TOPH_08239 [Tolypocladium ophioglossoides CBS 100239]|uniref:Uncharacterized protein n=1 Tax=Tolypocladium ophioglossoides (strain CBS 100239) TaxID=1163406 RepID=A0A0L0MZ20_TOLOC|nr:hypothetical protein TOPH_08239 [Tolypocladium ophioglossoides CBS 100239]